MPTSNALEYFRELQQQPNLYEHLSSFIQSAEPVVETEWLDFKGCKNLDHKSTLAKWAEALSGFGNTAGGVIIWGLDARKNSETGIDSVTGESLSRDVAQLEQTLRQSLHSACDPPITGVEFLPAIAPDGKQGYLVAYIPEGSLKPHRAEHGGKEFHLRVGDSFVSPNVSIIRSMFYSKQAPRLVPLVKIGHDDGGCVFWFELHNQGSATAEAIYISLEHSKEEKLTIARYPDIEGLSYFDTNLHFPLPKYVHPGMYTPCITLHHADRKKLMTRDIDGNPINFKMKIYCRDTQPLEWRQSIDHYMIAAQKRVQFLQTLT